MTESLRALLEGIVDYAGLFPPTKLSMKPAIENYARHRNHEDSWMLSRFICPAVRLEELSAAGGHLFAQNPPFRFSMLAGGGETVAEFQQNLEKQSDAVKQFLQQHGDNTVVDVFEIRLPQSLENNSSENDFSEIFSQLDRLRISANAENCFCEVPPMENWRKTVQSVVTALSNTNNGFKLRTGGVEPDAFPSCEKVATVVAACRDANICWKATAGLHHPIRHRNDTVKTKMHGFLNLLFAVVLSELHSLDEEQIATIIADENSESFRFDENGIRWHDYSANIDDIRRIRQARFAGFGSCSFDEPREDLQSMNLLP